MSNLQDAENLGKGLHDLESAWEHHQKLGGIAIDRTLHDQDGIHVLNAGSDLIAWSVFPG
jgi:hypothetical protein